MRLFLLFVFFFPRYALAQTQRSEILTDTSNVVGIVTEDCFVGEPIGIYCSISGDMQLYKGAEVLVSGIKNCKNTYSNVIKPLFEIIYKYHTYYIEKEKLLTDASCFTQLESMSQEMADSFRANALQASKSLYTIELRKALKFIEDCKIKGVTIIDWSFYDESEYTDGTGARIEVYNPTSKTIKYLWFTLVGFNPVGDKVIDIRKGTSNLTVQAVGPIDPKSSSTYEFDYVWFSDLIRKVSITSIKVQYMDGTIKTITNPKAITLPSDMYNILFGEQ